MSSIKNQKPLISIIMNCYNGQKYLNRSVKSVLSQTYKNWELIFWDNCSLDKSKKIFKKFKDNRLKYFKAKSHTTLYQARNLAVKKCKGYYICFLDVDDLWFKNKLEIQKNFFLKNKCKILYSAFQTFKSKKIINFINVKTGLNTTEDLLNNYRIAIMTVMLEKKIFNKIKFNNKYQIIGDFDFFLKASLKFSIHSINSCLGKYRVHKESLSVKKIDLYFDELVYWLKENFKKYNKYSLKKLIFNIFKIFIKKQFFLFLNFIK